MPHNAALQCTYDEMWVTVKAEWALGVTTAEQTAITTQLTGSP
jgi:hypothetical protein